MADSRPPPPKSLGRGRGRRPNQETEQNLLVGRGRGRGRSRMNWSGQSPGRPGPGASSAPRTPGVGPSQRGQGTRWTSQVHDGQPNPFLNAITKQNSNDPGPPKPDIRLEKSKAEMQILIRLAEKAGNTRSILYSHFSTTPNPSLSCLTLATQNKDFSLGKFEKSLTALVLTEFETWSRENSPAELSEPEKDLVFHLFSGHGNLKVITTAFSVFSLQCDRYYNVINEFCASNDYKRASQAAVALNSVNVFDISSTMCLNPEDCPSWLENRLKNSSRSTVGSTR